VSGDDFLHRDVARLGKRVHGLRPAKGHGGAPMSAGECCRFCQAEVRAFGRAVHG
jgi:hypothetical protein